MKIKALIFLLILVFAPLSVVAETVKINVNGMVCSFCAQGIKKKLGSNDAVKDVEVDLDKKQVTVNIKDGKSLSDDDLREIITKAGYEVEEIERAK